ncbi:MAG: 50S ribosomal protein L21 [bacterium]|nr:50S ribosomal protein L21 [bacterium]
MATAKPAKKETKKELKEFAIIETGGKQYLVSEGDTLKIEKMAGAHVVGGSVAFEKVLLHEKGSDTTIGVPYIKGAKVSAEIKKISRAKKVVVIKYKAKSNYFKKRGHRQPYFEVQITKLA